MKTDRLGRLRYAPEQKKAMVDAYLNSGLSAPRSAALHGVNYQTLVYWIKKSKAPESDPCPGVSHPALFSLIPAEIEQKINPARERLEVLLPRGSKIFISSPAQASLAAALIRV